MHFGNGHYTEVQIKTLPQIYVPKILHSLGEKDDASNSILPNFSLITTIVLDHQTLTGTFTGSH